MIYQRAILADGKLAGIIRDYIPDEDSLEKLSSLFSVIGDPTRLKLLSALSISHLCVTDLSALLKIDQTTVSHQLANMKSCGIVGCKRQGKIAFYFVKDRRVLDVLAAAADVI